VLGALHLRTATQKSRNLGLTLGISARRDREWSSNDEQIPNFVVRVHMSTGDNRVEGNRRTSRNGSVSDLPPETPHVAIRNLSHRCTPCALDLHAEPRAHLAVEVAVPVVVDGAARAPQQHGACAEQRQQLCVRCQILPLPVLIPKQLGI
jgi:hypothetical protein